ncbi:DUF4249 domain-containing protein [Bacteroidia bacterium]|nr:DUF4249 domain-containing protein [Bacteroidia bacterium]
MNKLITGILFLSFLSGCFTDTIQPNELLDYQHRMVVNAVVTAGEPVLLELTSSEPAIDSTLPMAIEDAIIEITTLGGVESMPYDIFNEYYKSSSSFVAGESINIIVSHPSFPNASSTISLPKAINSSGLMIEDGGIDTGGLAGDLLQVTLKDQGGINNYYKIRISYLNQTLGQWIPINFDKKDPSLADYNSYLLNDAGVLFSDELFDGQTKTISIVAPSGIVAGNSGDKYKIELSSISTDLYKYYSSLQRARDAKANGFQGSFNNAVVIHSNISRGLGILGAQTKNDIILK